jgi:hypothetical protein
LSEVSAGHGDEKQVLSHASFTCEHSYEKRKVERRTTRHDTRPTTRHDTHGTRGGRVANLEIEVKQAGKALGDVCERLAADGGAADVQQTQAVLRLRLADAQPLDLATTAAHKVAFVNDRESVALNHNSVAIEWSDMKKKKKKEKKKETMMTRTSH